MSLANIPDSFAKYLHATRGCNYQTMPWKRWPVNFIFSCSIAWLKSSQKLKTVLDFRMLQRESDWCISLVPELLQLEEILNHTKL